MKSFIPVLVFIFLYINPLFSQDDFKVIKVNGTILLREKGISLQTGTIFSENEDLLFRSEDATAAVINSLRGRVVITNKNHDLSAARTNNMPAMYNISSRSSSDLINSNLSSLFSGKYVVLDRQSIKIDEKNYQMDKDHFFFLRYIYKGEEINKKLIFSGDTLFIDKITLLSVDGNPIPRADNTAIKIFYRKGDESAFINEFDLIFPDMNLLKKEVEVILAELEDKPVSEQSLEIESYIYEFYGKVLKENLSEWLYSNFGLK